MGRRTRRHRHRIDLADQIRDVIKSRHAHLARDLVDLLFIEIADAHEFDVFEHFMFLRMKFAEMSYAHDGGAEFHRAIPRSEERINCTRYSIFSEGWHSLLMSSSASS